HRVVPADRPAPARGRVRRQASRGGGLQQAAARGPPARGRPVPRPQRQRRREGTQRCRARWSWRHQQPRRSVMELDVMTVGLPIGRRQDLARDAAAAGISGLVVTESGRTAYLSCAAAVLAADIDVLTGVAVAFPRSPMVTASTAWELAEASGGRF